MRIHQSGTSGNPITIGAYPVPCSSPPAIDGRVRVPADNWVHDHGGVYRATLPLNLVRNGAPTRAVSPWTQSNSPRGSLAFRRACNKPFIGCLHFVSPRKGVGLLASARFALKRGQKYRASFSIFVPRGVTVTARIRSRATAGATQLAAPQRIRGTGTWQLRGYDFIARASADDARLDFEVPATRAGSVSTQLREVAVEPYLASPVFLLMSGRILQDAHHPNFGHDPDAPDSPYLRNAADSNSNGAPGEGSTFVTAGNDLNLPSGVSLTPGTVIRLRSQNWRLDERTVTNFEGSRIHFSPASFYPLKQSWGYFLTGEPWMVDGPDEWHVDATTGSVTVWMPDSAPPGGRVMLSTLVNGLDLRGRHHIVVQGLAIRGVTTGVALENGRDIVLDDLNIEDVRGRGISMPRGQRIDIQGVAIRRTGLDAINACSSGAANCGSNNRVTDSTIEDSGVLAVSGRIASLPTPQDAALALGTSATVSGNRIHRTGTYGLFLRGPSTATGNSLTDLCMILDDCGGIYASGLASGSTIAGNLISHVHGNTAGTEFNATRAVGIYLDEQASNMQVHHNTAIDADNGIQIHNAFSNEVVSNTLFGNRINQLWLQEDTSASRSDGDIHSNHITENVLVPSNDAPALRLQSTINDVADFSQFTGNIYSTLLGVDMAAEVTPTYRRQYTFPAWQTAESNGAARNLDVTGRAVRLQGFAAFRRSSDNLLANGDLSAGLVGWSSFSASPPMPQLAVGSCPGACAQLLAGGGSSLLSTENFSVQEGHWYRVSFDAAVGVDGEPIVVVPRRGGGGSAGFETIGAGVKTFVGTTTMKRYSFVFQSNINITRNDPLTGERGARIDFQDILPGRQLSVANAEIVEVGFQDVTLRTAVLFNSDTRAQEEATCPDATSEPANCNAYVGFLDSAPIQFPHTLGPLEAKVIYTRDPALVDADNDGITDSQDSCPNSSQLLATNASGCDITQ